jgi:ribosomal protein L7/L12
MADDFELLQLKNRVAELESQVAYLYQHLGLFKAAVTTGEAAGDDPRIVELLRTGKLIDAIKVHRQLNNTGLVEAKEAVEEIKRRLRL